jgi:hypothetical protein
MLIDCDTCAMRDIACSDCVITMLLDGPTHAARSAHSARSAQQGVTADFDDDERRAVDALAGAGLIAPLRLVPLLEGGRRSGAGRRSIA